METLGSDFLKVFMRPKPRRSHRHAQKSVVNEGYQPTQQLTAAEGLAAHQPALLEEARESRELEGLDVQSAESRTHHKEGDGMGPCIPPSRDDSEEKKLVHTEEDLAAQDGRTERKMEEKQEEQSITEGPLVEEGEGERGPGGFPRYGEPGVCDVQNVEMPAAQVEEGMQTPERGGSFWDVNRASPLSVEDTSSEENRTSLPLTYECESLDTSHSHDHQSSVPVEPQGQESLQDQNEGLQSSHIHTLQEAQSKSHAIEIDTPFTEIGPHIREEPEVPSERESSLEIPAEPFEKQVEEGEITYSSPEGHDQCRREASDKEEGAHEHIREEPKLPSEQESSLEIPGGYKQRPDKKEDLLFPGEPFEKEVEEGEMSYSAPEGYGQWGRETSDMETGGDLQPRKGGPLAKDLADTPPTEEGTHELIREEPELSFEKELTLETPGGDNERQDEKEDVLFPAEPFEKEVEEGETSYRSPEGHEQSRMEASDKETGDDVQPQRGGPAKDLAESLVESGEDYLSEATSSAEPSPHVYHGGIESQDRTQVEQKIMADIDDIKKIVGYQGEPHASIMEQISALYLFLGMEPYKWGAEVDNLQRARAEIELLKVVVGVK